MTGRPSRGSIRAALTLWYAGVLAAILTVYAVGVYAFLRHSLYEELERQVQNGAGPELVMAEAPGGRTLAGAEERIQHELNEYLVAMALGLPVAVLLACVGGFWLAGRALNPVGEMATRAATITAERLSERLPIRNPNDELGRLGSVVNETLGRLERSFESLRRFTADAAHELRTPLTALRSVGEVALRERRTEAGYREVVGSMLEEADRLSGLVDSLLALSRAEGGHVAVRAERLSLMDLARQTSEYLCALAEEKGQSIAVEGEESVYADVDPRLIRQALSNILDNAISYSPEGSPIRIVIRREGHDALLEVIDHGPGVAPAHRERIFERFYRVDPARSRETGGTGLGLAIAQWAVRANGGTIEIHDGPDGSGSCFRIRLPSSA